MTDKGARKMLQDDELLTPAVLVHELRSPLGAIKGFASLIAEQAYGPIGDDRYLAAAQQMELAAQHMEQLVDSVLGAAHRNVVGCEGLGVQEVDLVQLVENAQVWLRSKIVKHKVVVRFRTLLNPVQVVGDARRLRQAFLNVLDNAIRYTPEAGHVDVSIMYRDDGGVDLCVVNDVNVQAAELIGDDALSGQGLGVYVTRAQMRAHGGAFVITPGDDGRVHAVLSLPSERTVS